MPLSPVLVPLCMCPEDEARASVRETQSTGLPTHCLMLCSVPQNLTYEIILTLGQAFEVAYQLALQAQKSRPLGASAADTIETKSSKPVPKPRATSRKSTVREPGDGGKRGAPHPQDRPCSHTASRGQGSCRVQRAPSNAALCLSALLCAQVPPPPDSRCCHCHTCTTHRPSYLPLPSVSPGVKVLSAVCVCLSVPPAMGSPQGLFHFVCASARLSTVLSPEGALPRHPPRPVPSTSGAKAQYLQPSSSEKPLRGTSPGEAKGDCLPGLGGGGRRGVTSNTPFPGHVLGLTFLMGDGCQDSRVGWGVPDTHPSSWQLEPPDMDQDAQHHASVSWVVDPKPDSKRSLSTKYETTIF